MYSCVDYGKCFLRVSVWVKVRSVHVLSIVVSVFSRVSVWVKVRSVHVLSCRLWSGARICLSVWHSCVFPNSL